MKTRHVTPAAILGKEDGAVLIVALLILFVLTIIGIAATNTSVLETLISNASKKKQTAFYAAEAGIEHARGYLMGPLGQANPAGVVEKPTWEFVKTDSHFDDVQTPNENSRPGERVISAVENKVLGDHTYTVTIYDKEWTLKTGGARGEDTDGKVWVRSVAVANTAAGSRAAIEVELLADQETRRFMDYGGQDKKGGAKASSNTDTQSISSFSEQLRRAY